VNARVHRVTRRVPAEMLAAEQGRLHPVPTNPYTVAFGVTRTVPAKMPMVSYDGAQYSVPSHLLGQTVWVRVHGAGGDEQVIIVHVGPAGPLEVARHGRATPGSPKMTDAHFPPAPAGALGRIPKARNGSEAAFLELGDGVRLWLIEAAAAGTTKIRVKMAEAVLLNLVQHFGAGAADLLTHHRSFDLELVEHGVEHVEECRQARFDGEVNPFDRRGDGQPGVRDDDLVGVAGLRDDAGELAVQGSVVAAHEEMTSGRGRLGGEGFGGHKVENLLACRQ
jgi:hypothetical protein